MSRRQDFVRSLARELLQRQGRANPSPVELDAIAGLLDDPLSAQARGLRQGFDFDTPLYAPFGADDLNPTQLNYAKDGPFGPGAYLARTDMPEVLENLHRSPRMPFAPQYAGGTPRAGVPVVGRQGRFASEADFDRAYGEALEMGVADYAPASLDNLASPERAANALLRGEGYTGIDTPGGRMFFNPEDVRRPDALFLTNELRDIVGPPPGQHNLLMGIGGAAAPAAGAALALSGGDQQPAEAARPTRRMNAEARALIDDFFGEAPVRSPGGKLRPQERAEQVFSPKLTDNENQALNIWLNRPGMTHAELADELETTSANAAYYIRSARTKLADDIAAGDFPEIPSATQYKRDVNALIAKIKAADPNLPSRDIADLLGVTPAQVSKVAARRAPSAPRTLGGIAAAGTAFNLAIDDPASADVASFGIAGDDQPSAGQSIVARGVDVMENVGDAAADTLGRLSAGGAGDFAGRGRRWLDRQFGDGARALADAYDAANQSPATMPQSRGRFADALRAGNQRLDDWSRDNLGVFDAIGRPARGMITDVVAGLTEDPAAELAQWGPAQANTLTDPQQWSDNPVGVGGAAFELGLGALPIGGAAARRSGGGLRGNISRMFGRRADDTPPATYESMSQWARDNFDVRPASMPPQSQGPASLYRPPPMDPMPMGAPAAQGGMGFAAPAAVAGGAGLAAGAGIALGGRDGGASVDRGVAGGGALDAGPSLRGSITPQPAQRVTGPRLPGPPNIAMIAPEAVNDAQRALVAAGADIAIDNIWGPQTAAAANDIMARAGLTPLFSGDDQPSADDLDMLVQLAGNIYTGPVDPDQVKIEAVQQLGLQQALEALDGLDGDDLTGFYYEALRGNPAWRDQAKRMLTP